MSLFLTEDVTGPYSGKLYGRQGEEVTLVSDHGDMLICEAGGQRFPVKKNVVSDTPVAVARIAEEAPPVKHPTKRTAKKAKPLTNKLF